MICFLFSFYFLFYWFSFLSFVYFSKHYIGLSCFPSFFPLQMIFLFIVFDFPVFLLSLIYFPSLFLSVPFIFSHYYPHQSLTLSNLLHVQVRTSNQHSIKPYILPDFNTIQKTYYWTFCNRECNKKTVIPKQTTYEIVVGIQIITFFISPSAEKLRAWSKKKIIM